MNKPIYCWDSCIFLGWLGGNYAGPIEGVQAIVAEIEESRAILITSAIVYAEVLQSEKTPKNAILKFEKFLRRNNVEVFDVSIPILKDAGKIRSGCLLHKPKLATPGAEDSIYASTAMKAKATVLHTIDPKLLKLNVHEIVGGLRIEIPPVPRQASFC